MHNNMHNMDDESMPLPSHVTLRNGVYQYVRRVPDDIAEAFASARIQRSLKTRLPSEARIRSARIDIEIEKQFADARAKRGFRIEPVFNEGWTWPDWEKAFAWLTATWIEEDTEVRAKLRTGRHVSALDSETRTATRC